MNESGRSLQKATLMLDRYRVPETGPVAVER